MAAATRRKLVNGFTVFSTKIELLPDWVRKWIQAKSTQPRVNAKFTVTFLKEQPVNSLGRLQPKPAALADHATLGVPGANFCSWPRE
jgi:hypothetical protein